MTARSWIKLDAYDLWVDYLLQRRRWSKERDSIMSYHEGKRRKFCLHRYITVLQNFGYKIPSGRPNSCWRVLLRRFIARYVNTIRWCRRPSSVHCTFGLYAELPYWLKHKNYKTERKFFQEGYEYYNDSFWRVCPCCVLGVHSNATTKKSTSRKQRLLPI